MIHTNINTKYNIAELHKNQHQVDVNSVKGALDKGSWQISIIVIWSVSITWFFSNLAKKSWLSDDPDVCIKKCQYIWFLKGHRWLNE